MYYVTFILCRYYSYILINEVTMEAIEWIKTLDVEITI